MFISPTAVSYMLNVSSETPGIGAGVLIRALEPLEGIPIMRLNRGVERLRDLARGPGRLAAALRIDRSLDGLDLCREGPLWLGRGDHEPGEIGQSIRIGISRDANRLLRFYLRDSPFVSGPRWYIWSADSEATPSSVATASTARWATARSARPSELKYGPI